MVRTARNHPRRGPVGADPIGCHTGSVESRLVILSDRSIREALAAGRIVIDPIDEKDVQPSSVDLHIDRYFRVFRNDTTPYIDPKQPQEDLTEIVEVTTATRSSSTRASSCSDRRSSGSRSPTTSSPGWKESRRSAGSVC